MARRRISLRLDQLEDRIVPSVAVIGTWQSDDGSATVTALDMEGAPDIDADNILVKFSGNRVKSVKLTGFESMDGLALVFNGATEVDKIKDLRSGTLGDLAFIVSDATIKNIQLKSGIEGYDVNGMTVGGVALPADIDGDGQVDDPLALFISGVDSKGRALRSKFTAHDTVAGDMVFEGHTGKISVSDGDLDGDIVLHSNAREIIVRDGDLNGDVTVAGNARITVRNGDLNGDVETEGDARIDVRNGDLNGDVAADGDGRIAVRDGDLNGDVEILADARKIKVTHGDGNGDVTVDGHLSKYKVKGVYNSALKAYVSGGNIGGDVTAETIGELRATGGDLSGTVTATGADSHGWAIRSIGAKRGDVTGDMLALTGGIKDFFAKGSRNPFSFEIEYDGGTFSGRAFSAGVINSFKSICMEGAFLNALSINKMTVDTDMADSTTLAGYLYGSDFTLGGGDDESNAGSIESVNIKGWLRDSDIAASATPGASGFFGDGDDVDHDAGEITKVTIKRGIEIGGDPHGIIATSGTMKFKLGSTTTKLVEGQSTESSGLVISII